MSLPKNALDLAAHVVDRAKALGVDELSVGVSESTNTEISRREERVEQASSSSTRRLGLSLLIDGRWSTHSTSDLRADALDVFLRRAVDATRWLEPDPDRALAPPELCGRGASEAHLDHHDPAWDTLTADDRADWCERLERAVLARKDDRFISASVDFSDGGGKHTQVTSHGFADVTDGAWFSFGGSVTLSDEGGRRPEGSSHYAARYLSDLPPVERVAEEAHRRAHEAIGSGPIESGRYPMILANRVAGRILGTLAGPIDGGSIHHGRTCLGDRLNTAIGSEHLTLIDDPTIPRGLGSSPWDDDLMVARPRVVIEKGVLRMHYLSTYYARKLGRPVTTGSSSNWVVSPGARSPEELSRTLPKAILVTGWLGGNANPVTGDFSYGIRGKLLEYGEPTKGLSEMNVTGNIATIFHQLAEVANDPWLWSSTRTPTMLFHDVQFSGT